LPCYQKWDNMLPSDKGRICTGCGKLVTDLRKSSWSTIEKIHNTSPNPVCGIYSEEQLNMWGHALVKQQSSSSKLVTITAALLAFIQLSPKTVQSQTSEKKQQTQPVKRTSQPAIVKPTKKFVSGTIIMLLPDSSKRPLKNASISFMIDTSEFRGITDSVGRFAIDVTNEFNILPDIIKLIISPAGFPAKSISLEKNNLKPIDIILSQSETERAVLLPPIVHSFYALPPSNDNPVETQKAVKKHWWQWWRKVQ